MKLTFDNLQKVKELCKSNPNEVIDIDGIAYCWVVDSKEFKYGAFRVSFSNGWETLYI